MRCTGLGSGIVLAVMIGLASVVNAQPAGVDGETAVMGEVVVTASREKETDAGVPVQVMVIDGREIERSSAQNVPELLAEAGLHVSDLGGNQRNYTVDLRGFGEVAAANMLVLVDGRRINVPNLSTVDWSLIPLDRIERIEVMTGSRGGVLLGENTAGGVVNIITREGQDREARVSVEYGSYDTYRGSAGIGGSAGIISYDVSASYLNSDGYRDNGDTEATDVGANVRFDPNDKASIFLSGGYHKDDTGLPGAILLSQFAAGADRTATFYPDDFAETQDYYGQLGLELFFLTNDAFRVDVSARNRDVDQFASFTGGFFTGQTEVATIAVSPRLTFQEDFGDVSNRLILGGDVSRNEQDVDNFSSFTGRGLFELEKESFGYYINDDLGLTENLTLSGGYRYDRAEYSFSSGPQDDKTYDEEAFTAGINYAVGSAKVFANFGRSFRYPLLDEIFNYFDNSASSGLQPQNSDIYEAGTRFLLARDLRFTFSLFRIETEDEILYNPVGGPFGLGANENLDGDTIRNGFDVRFDYRRLGWTAGAGYTLTNAEIDGGQYDDSTIPNVPMHRGHANVGYAFDFGLYVGFNAIYVGSRYLISDFNNVFEKQDAYTVINSKVKYDWRWLTFFVDVNNIFDEEYASYGGLNYLNEPGFYPSPEFNVLAGITARLGGK